MFNNSQSLKNILNNEREYRDYYASSENYINSTWVKRKLKEVFNPKSTESPRFYMEAGEILMKKVNVAVYSIENALDQADAYHALYNTTKNLSKESYDSLGKEEQNAIDNILRLAAENFNYVSYGANDSSMSLEYFQGKQPKEARGLGRIFQTIIAAIKRIIVAIANFFRGIFTAVRGIFRKFTFKQMQKYFAIAEGVVKSNPKLMITLKNYDKGGISPNFVKNLNEIPKTAQTINKTFDQEIAEINKFAAKKTNLFDAAMFNATLKARGMRLEGLAKSLLNHGLKIKTSNGRIMITNDARATINELIFSKNAKPSTSVKIPAKDFINHIKRAGLDKYNMDQSLNSIQRAMTDLQSKVSAAEGVFKKVEANTAAQKNVIVRSILKWVQDSFSTAVSICNAAIKFYNSNAGAIYKVYTQIVNGVVKLAKQDPKFVTQKPKKPLGAIRVNANIGFNNNKSK